MQNCILLIIRPLPHWSLTGVELRRVAALGRYMEAKAAVRAEWADDEELRQLATLCEDLQADAIYTRYANKKLMRHTDDFWASDDATLQQHVKRRCDELLLKVVQMAHAMDIPMLYQPTESSPLHIGERLTLLDDTEAVPVMCFRRHETGISYTLKLKLLPTHHADRQDDTQGATTLTADDLAGRLTVLGFQPGLFVHDHRLALLAEGFSGKLLMPFTTKTCVEIPRRIENDYMRRFILRNVSRAEVEAEGFDINDTGDAPLPRLHTETSIDGHHLLSLRFHYGSNDYVLGSKSNGRVTLTATSDGGFRFTRQMRDRQLEQHYAAMLADMGPLRFDTTADMVDWLRQNVPTLRSMGFDVVQPSDKAYYIGPLNLEQSDTWHGDWLQTDVTIVLDDGRLRVPFLDLRDTILRGEQTYMLPTGELLLIPPEWLKRYTPLLLLGMSKGHGFQRHRSQLAPSTTPPSPTDLPSPRKEPGTSLSPTPPTAPAALRATLRPYQLKGYQWLWSNFEARTGCCLSDEMGLGKTLQTIALLLKYKDSAAAFPAASASASAPIPSASSSAAATIPDASASAAATIPDASASGPSAPAPGFLFSEEEMRGEALPPPLFPARERRAPSRHHHTSLVIAPASVVHNWQRELQRFAPTLTVCAYTGHVANRRDKLRNLMQFDVAVTAYRTLTNDIDYLCEQQFGIVVFDESQAFKTPTSQVHHAVTRLQALHRLALSGTPVENNLMELWSLMNVLNPPLLGSQANFRKAFVGPIARQIEDDRTTLLQQLIAPYFLKRTKQEVLTDLPPRQDEVVVCPMTESQASQYAEELSCARNELLDKDGSAQLDKNQRFHVLAALQRLRHIANGEGKLTAIFDHLEALRGTSHKVLLFSEYVTMLERVADQMRQRGWTYAMLTGQTTDRKGVIDHFQDTPSCQFFLISLKAGGVGLNLTAADYVMLIDPWWNQAAEEQAIARAHRLGQQQHVFVYRFVSENTLEQQILDLQERKQTLIDSVMPFLATDKKS